MIGRAQDRTVDRDPGSYASVLAHPGFRGLWLAVVSTSVSDAIMQIALPILVYQITGSAGLMSVILVIQVAPRVILAPVAGVMADRLDRRLMMMTANGGRAIGLLLMIGATEAWHVAAMAALISVGTVAERAAELPAITSAAPPGQMVSAISLTQVATNTTRIVGPAVAGAIIGLTSTDLAFALAALFLGVSVFWLRRTTLPVVERPADEPGILASMRGSAAEGLTAAWASPIVRGVFASEGCWQILTAVLSVTVVIYTHESLDLGERSDLVYGLLMAALSAGAVLGALFARRLERTIGRPTMMMLGYFGPLMIVPAALQPPLPVLFLCWIVLGFTDAWAVIGMLSYLAEAVPDDLRGRVFALMSGINAAALLLAYVGVGALTERLGAPRTLGVTGLLVGLGGPLLLFATGAMADIRSREASPTSGPQLETGSG